MIITYTTPEELNIASQICLEHKLFVGGWSFQQWVDDLYRSQLKVIMIYWIDKKPVGISIAMCKYGCNVGFFVSPQYRYIGIGRELFHQMRKFTKKINLKFQYGRGEAGSELFFKKCLDSM